MIITLNIKIDGSPLDNKVYPDLVEVVVDTSLYLPDMFTLMVKDDWNAQGGKFLYLDSDTPFAVGKAIVIAIKAEYDGGSAGEGTIFTGEITGIEPIFAENGIGMLRVRGYNKAHRLTYGKKTRTFLDMTDADIIGKIVGEAGLSKGTMDASLTKVTYKYMMQYNQSDWEFLWARARLYGCHVYVDDKGKLNVAKADPPRSTLAAALEWEINLSSFEPRLTVVGAVNKASALGWDTKKKEAIVGQASSAGAGTYPEIGLGKKGSQMLSSGFSISAAEDTTVNLPVGVVNEATGLAQARLDEAEGTFVTAEGLCRWGDPRLLAGTKVEIKGVGTRWSGKYLVTSARHVIAEGGYSVNFSVSGRRPDTLHDLLGGNGGDGRNLVQGVVVGIVTNIDDPDKTGKVKVKFPWINKLNGAELESNWARVMMPSGGKERGFYYLPEVNDEVMVTFEHGDINFPYVVGAVWNGVDKPPPGEGDIVKDGKVNQRIIKSRSGHIIILDDTQNAEKIVVKDKSGNNSIIIDSKNKTMTFKCEGDITIEAGGLLKIKSTKDFSIESQAKGTIKTTQDMALESTTKASIKGTSGLALESTGEAKLKGMMVEVSGDTKATLKGSAMVEISGGLVKIN